MEIQTEIDTTIEDINFKASKSTLDLQKEA